MLHHWDFLSALGRVWKQNGPTFSPGRIAEEISRNTGQPEDAVLGDTIEQCRTLVESGVLWCTEKHIYIRKNTCIIVRPDFKRILRKAIGDAESKRNELAPSFT